MTLLSSFQEIHIENTNSCGYKCKMCPRDEQTRAIGFMGEEDFLEVLREVEGFKGIFHLHGFGEPLLDRKLIAKTKLLKEKCPSSSLQLFSTLGVKLEEGFFEKLIEAGLTDLIISFYGFNEREYQNIHGFNGFERAKKNLEMLSREMKRFPSFRASLKVPKESLSSSLPLVDSLDKKAFKDWAKDLGFYLIEWSYVHNYGSGREYNKPGCKTCPVLNGARRHILNITWDLNVVPCAYDFNGTMVFGNLRSQTLEEIFAGGPYLDFVLSHSNGDLSAYPTCQNCEKEDYR